MKTERSQTRIVIMGAAGRDFDNFNQVYRHNSNVEVVAFTAGQISGIANHLYPASLAGYLYPKGIAIVDEKEWIISVKTKVSIKWCLPTVILHF
ncbi:MAG: hypothetical protein QNJ64_10940 [Crocosphaera sp.]|nr:hypothetical protein [Crocosphaera sp.]